MSIPIPVLVHLGFSLAALVLIPVAIFAHRLGIRHRVAGRAAAFAMAGAALSALALTTHGPSPLHVLALVMLTTIALAIRAVRRGRVEAHRRMMLICAGSLIVAGIAAAAIPGRVLHGIVF